MRLIDADALKEDLKESKEKLWEIYNGLSHHTDKQICGGQIGTFTEVILRMNDASTIDAVPVVRCKDCKHWGGITFGNVCRRWSAPLAGMKNCTSADDFCSYGERKENTDG